MRRILAPFVLALSVANPLAKAGDPIVFSPPGSTPTPVLVIQDSKHLFLTTVPWPNGIPWPLPGPTPTPGPTPQPIPTPPTPPVVVTGPLTVTYVAAAEPTPDQAAMTRNSVIDAAMPTLDASWRWYEADEPGIQVKGATGESILSLAQKAGLPAVVIQRKTGQVVGDPIPATTPEAIVSHLKTLRGVR